jgi:hypothetical protein
MCVFIKIVGATLIAFDHHVPFVNLVEGPGKSVARVGFLPVELLFCYLNSPPKKSGLHCSAIPVRFKRMVVPPVTFRQSRSQRSAIADGSSA